MNMLTEANMREVVVSADGVPIYYEVYGQGMPALVFVHGWSCNRSHWHKQVEHFAKEYRVVVIDLAGHGESGQNRSSWTMAAFGQDVVAVVEQLKLAQVVLIGHSMGGTIIVEAAKELPTQVIGLVGVDTFRDLGATYSKEQIDEIMDPFRLNFREACNEFVRTGMFLPTSDAALVDTIAESMAAADPKVAVPAAEALWGHSAERRTGLQAIQVPVTAINADYHSTDLESARRYGVKVEPMADVGHFGMLEDPETFNYLLEQTIKQFQAAALQVRHLNSKLGSEHSPLSLMPDNLPSP